jgi:rfaE bifunctional protein nucleotidyltransferase chain/domain
MKNIFDRNEAILFAHDAKAKGKHIVTANGTFDLFSVAHLRFLEKASSHGDVLIVGINSDASVKKLKGEKRPIIPQHERATIVAGIRCVDGVFIFDDPDPREWIKTIRPDTHCNGAEYTEQCIEAETIKEIGARLILLPRATDVISTHDAIEMIQKRYC